MRGYKETPFLQDWRRGPFSNREPLKAEETKGSAYVPLSDWKIGIRLQKLLCLCPLLSSICFCLCWRQSTDDGWTQHWSNAVGHFYYSCKPVIDLCGLDLVLHIVISCLGLLG